MDERNKLNKQNFIILSICLSVVCAIIVSAAIVPGLGTTICGFIPVGLVSFCCAVGQIAGTIYYINKHQYAYGDLYEWYQILNASIYGIQNVLRVMLVVLLINICAIPIFVIIFIVYGVCIMRKIFKL